METADDYELNPLQELKRFHNLLDYEVKYLYRNNV